MKIDAKVCARLGRAMASEAMLDYIVAHPNATPEEVMAHFGLPFDRAVWNASLERNTDALGHLQQSPNPNDRKNWAFRRDD